MSGESVAVLVEVAGEKSIISVVEVPMMATTVFVTTVVTTGSSAPAATDVGTAETMSTLVETSKEEDGVA